MCKLMLHFDSVQGEDPGGVRAGFSTWRNDVFVADRDRFWDVVVETDHRQVHLRRIPEDAKEKIGELTRGGR